MKPPVTKSQLNDPVTAHMHGDFTRLSVEQTVGEALAWLRKNPPHERIIYLYVVDRKDRLVGVVPTRRLLLSEPDQRLEDIMVRDVIALPSQATVHEACEFFIQHRFLAFPVVDAQQRMIGVIDVELYTDELIGLGPVAPMRRWLQPLTSFLRIESVGGIVLLACTTVALVLANSRWSAPFAATWQTPIGLTLGGFELTKPLVLWINDGLMTLFFFVIGLEVKRELLLGELNPVSKALLPIVAAVGGMAAPALVYLVVLWGRASAVGWGIPTATDIAFAVGFLTLFGKRVPHSLKILVLTLAIVDDIGATLVIALVYTSDISGFALGAGLAGFALVVLLRWIGVRSLLTYVLVGAGIWIAFVKSGVHPTVAGVILGLLTPARPWRGDRVPIDVVTDLFRRLSGLDGDTPNRQPAEPASPLDRLERALHPWVAFGIMPLFALANAGVEIDMEAFGKPITYAVAIGLVVGKPIGIVLFTWLAIRAGLVRLPGDITDKILIGAGCLAGIGFTMSLFIAGLALHGPELEQAKLGVLGGSTISAAIGSLLLWRYLPAAEAT